MLECLNIKVVTHFHSGKKSDLFCNIFTQFFAFYLYFTILKINSKVTQLQLDSDNNKLSF